jgi:hypothetical protein
MTRDSMTKRPPFATLGWRASPRYSSSGAEKISGTPEYEYDSSFVTGDPALKDGALL